MSPAGLSLEQLRATTDVDTPADVAWRPCHAALLDAVDELHDRAHLPQPVRDALREHYDDARLLESPVLAGWYRTIGHLANGLLLEKESWGIPFPVR
ncbi:hypothetical protein [Streptomyces sp. NPDC001450]